MAPQGGARSVPRNFELPEPPVRSSTPPELQRQAEARVLPSVTRVAYRKEPRSAAADETQAIAWDAISPLAVRVVNTLDVNVLIELHVGVADDRASPQTSPTQWRVGPQETRVVVRSPLRGWGPFAWVRWQPEGVPTVGVANIELWTRGVA